MGHPGKNKGDALVCELAEKGELGGVEVWHPSTMEDDLPTYMEIAQRNGLIMTGGTDFHGMYTQTPRAMGTCTTPQEQLDELKKRKARLLKASG